MIYVLIMLLVITFILPLASRKVEKNLELFLFIIGFLAVITSGVLSKGLILEILENKFMYIIALAVLVGGYLFRFINKGLKDRIDLILKYMPLKVFVFLLVVFIGLLSSVITAIIAALLLVEIICVLPITNKNKASIAIISCFSIGLGAVLTPVGEPLSTIVVSKLDVSFWYLFKQLGLYIIPGIIGLGIFGTRYAEEENMKIIGGLECINEETDKIILVRALKIFLFIIALELLGQGFRPIIDTYIITIDIRYLYWINLSSAVLDNATLAAAEISSKMSPAQVKAILMGLLISGGMMIPGNIPNIISAGKLKIRSREWIKLGVPLGLSLMIIYYIVLFIL